VKEKLTKLVKDELSGEIAKSYVAQITRFHRIQASPMFHEAAEYVRDTLRGMGIKDVRIEQFPSDGRTEYWTHTSPVGWEVTRAELRLVEPEAKLITKYKDVPTCLHTHSKSTKPEGVTAELVDVGEGTKPEHYTGKKVKGKFVLATGRAKPVHEHAVYKHGAAGVITDTLTHEMKGVRESIDIPDAHAYQAIWPTKQDVDKVTFGFSLSKRQGNHLRALLKDKKSVKLNAKVDARLFSSNLDIVTATIQGRSRPDEEIFLIAHLCHPKPSANDNASGSGLLLEIARTIHELIESGAIEIARTIRFLWVPETFGTVAYLHRHEALTARLVAGINLDMVGQNQELCRSTLNLDKTPDSNPSYLNDYVFSLLKQSVEEFDAETAFGSASTFRYSPNAFSGGSDHAEFNDSSFGVPCVMLLQWPDLYYHSSMDTIDKVSEDSLRRVGWIATVATLTLANASIEEANFLANLTRLGAMGRLAEASHEALITLFQRKGDSTETAHQLARLALQFRNKMQHIVWREKKAVDSVRELASSLELEERITRYEADIEHYGQTETDHFDEAVTYIAKARDLALPSQPEKAEPTEKAETLVPKRLFKGTLSSDAFKRKLGETDYRWYEELRKKDKDFRKKTYEIVNFIDGNRSVVEITRAVSAEYGETELEHVLKFIRDLETAKFVSFQ
jgi:Zn-dependent M28 family amino/carboxypeptidase